MELEREMAEYIELVMQKSFKDVELREYAKQDPRLAVVLGRALKEAEGKQPVIQRLKVNSVVAWYGRLLAKEVKEAE